MKSGEEIKFLQIILIVIFLVTFQININCKDIINKHLRLKALKVPMKIYASRGDNFEIKADFFNIKTKNIHVQWEPEYGKSIDKQITNSYLRDEDNLTSSLSIKNLQGTTNEIFYSCYLFDNETVIDFKIFEIEIIDKVNIDHKLWKDLSFNIKIYARTNESIKFITKGFIEKYAFLWFFHNTEIESRYPKCLASKNIRSYGEISELTILDINESHSGDYSLFYSDESAWPIFNMEVLQDIKLEMKKFHYFPNTTKNSMLQIKCQVYGLLNEEIEFSYEFCQSIKDGRCNLTKTIFKNSRENVKIEKQLHEKTIQNYVLTLPVTQSGNLSCSSKIRNVIKNSVVIQVDIASYPEPFDIQVKPSDEFNDMYGDSYDAKNGILKANLGEKVVLDCVAVAYPYAVNITWDSGSYELPLHSNVFHDDDEFNVEKNVKYDGYSKFLVATLSIKNSDKESNQTYTCTIYSLDVSDYLNKTIRVIFQPQPHSYALWIIIKVVIIVIIILIIFLIACRKYQEKNRLENLNALGLKRMAENYYSIYDFIKDLPYDKSFEFPEKRLKFGKCLGYGNFGMVHQGLAKKIVPKEDKTIVAVKTVKDTQNFEALSCLISEMKIMIHLGKHLNVVNLLGAITKNLNKGELKVIVEYCPYGNLEIFLKKHRNRFVNQIDPISGLIDPKIIKDVLSGENTPNPLENVQNTPFSYIPSNTALIPTTSKSNENEITYLSQINETEKQKKNEHDSIGTYPLLTTTDLICWAFQITRGMDYISKRNIMHGDLAARNILLAEDNIVKICDFGLAKSISGQYGNYIKKPGGALPLKWLAIESLRDNEFSIKSDVWSFGILLWELFSLGCNPYPGVSARGVEFYKMLRDGYRMEKPEFSNQELYGIMLHCWKQSPTDRPKFSDLEETLAKFLESDIYMHYIHMNEPYLQANDEYFNNQGDNRANYLTMLKLPQETVQNLYTNAEPNYVNRAESLPSVSELPENFVKTPEFEFVDKDNGSPHYQNNFNSLKRQKKTVKNTEK